MISFIIFESDPRMMDLYIKVLKKFLYTSHDYYKMHEFYEYNCLTRSKLESIEGKRIYLINSELHGINGFELARRIRQHNSISDSIIMIVPREKKYNIKTVKGTMILDVIEQNDRLINELLETVKEAYRIATNFCALTFSSFDEIYRLPYDDIYYIEKDIHDDTITIYTKDDTYTHYISIKKMAEKLKNDPRFFRSHRSCIINLYRISSYNCKDNIITFDNGLTIDLVSRDNKKRLTERLKNDFMYQ